MVAAKPNHTWLVWAIERIGLPTVFVAMAVGGLKVVYDASREDTKAYIQSMAGQVKTSEHVLENRRMIAENMRTLLSTAKAVESLAKISRENGLLIKGLLELKQGDRPILERISKYSEENANIMAKAHEVMMPAAADRREMVEILREIRNDGKRVVPAKHEPAKPNPN